MINWGIIGCGDVTEVKSGPAFNLIENSRLLAVMRRDAAKAEDYAKRHNVPFWYTDADALIHNPEIDAVYIATPVGSHTDYALRVCAAGKPCYVEKPPARNQTECRRMLEAFSAAELPLFVAYYRRCLPRFIKVRELIAAGLAGRITSVNYVYTQPRHLEISQPDIPWRLNAQDSGGGIFMDMGCHTLDILDFMLGPLQKVAGIAENLATDCDVEDTVAMLFSTADGACGTALWNFAGAEREDMITVTGTKGQIQLSTFRNEPVRFKPHGQPAEEFELPNPAHIQQPLIQTIVDQLNGKGTCPSTGTSALRTAIVMDAVLNDYYGGRQDAFWARPASWPGNRR